MLYNVTDDDHIPFIVNLNVDDIPKITNETNDLVPKINWNNVKDSELQKYYQNTCESLREIEIPTIALSCKDLKCNNALHNQELCRFYKAIIDSLYQAGLHLTNINNSTDNYVQRPGWTQYVSDLYDYSKTCRRIWLNANEPRQGSIHEEYVKSRTRFKYALRFISRNEEQMRKEALAKKLSRKKNQ